MQNIGSPKPRVRKTRMKFVSENAVSREKHEQLKRSSVVLGQGCMTQGPFQRTISAPLEVG